MLALGINREVQNCLKLMEFLGILGCKNDEPNKLSQVSFIYIAQNHKSHLSVEATFGGQKNLQGEEKEKPHQEQQRDSFSRTDRHAKDALHIE